MARAPARRKSATKPLEAAGRPVFIVDGARTPFLKAGSAPGPFSPVDLAVQCGRPLLARQPFAPSNIDEVILGCVNVPAAEVNPGRVAALRLGCGTETPGWTVQRNCASGQQSIDTAWRYIAAGHADLILAGGAEALSHAPLLFSKAGVAWFGRFMTAKTMGDKLKALSAFRPGVLKPEISILIGLTDPVAKINMGQTAEVLAHRFAISRREMDEYAVSSHHRLAAAHAEGRLPELEAMVDRKGTVYDFDNGVRPDNSPEQLAKLKPAFERPFGKVTAGNSSQITDGASWTIVASEDAIKRFGLNPMARIIDCRWGSCDPSVMGLGPVLASTAVMKRHGLKRTDIGAWELNEAFAAQVLACLKAWTDKDFCRELLGLDEAFGEVDHEKLNVDGGAIALGHPVGTSGNRITLHLIHVMRRLGARLGIATECIGGGMGGAMLLELV